MTRSMQLLRCALIACALPSVLPSAQQRDAPALPALGTGSISGTVIDDATGQPVSRAKVMIGGSTVGLIKSISTDDAGRFFFGDVQSRDYVIYVRDPRYLPAQYGASGQGRPGTIVAVADGQQISNLTIRLIRGGVLTGTVSDGFGEPREGAGVRLLRWGYSPSGTRALVSAALAAGRTDDRGVYRMAGVPPGEYFVLVARYPQEGLVGPVGFEEALPITHADIEAVLTGRRPSAAASSTNPRRVAFAPTFYPSVVVAADARPITIAAGEERSGVDVVTRPVPLATLRGRVILPNGVNPQLTQVQLFATDPIAALNGSSMDWGSSDSKGVFTFREVLPASYVLTAQVFLADADGPGTGGAQPGPPRLALWSMLPVDVDGHDIPDLTLALQPTTTLSGRVVAAGAAPETVRLDQLTVRLVAVVANGQVNVSGAPATADLSGRFRITGVTPGRYRVDIGPAGGRLGGPSGVWLASAMVNGVNAADLPVELGATDVSDVALTVTAERTQLSGTLRDRSGRVLPGFSIVAFSMDRSSWMPQSRRTASARVGSDGTFKLADLPPGEYYVAAAADVENGQWFDPDFLAQLASAPLLRLSLAPGEKRVVELTRDGR